MSTSLLPGLLTKRHLEKDEDTKEVLASLASGGSSEGVGAVEGAVGALARSSPPTLPPGAETMGLPFPTREQCASVAQLLQYVHSLVVSHAILYSCNFVLDPYS